MISILLSFEDFNELVKNNPVVLVEFKAKWCVASNMISYFVSSLANKYTDIKFANIDVDNIDQANLEKFDNNFNLGAIPSFYLFCDGVLTDKLIGASHQKLESFINSFNSNQKGEVNDDFDLKEKRANSEPTFTWTSVKPTIGPPRDRSTTEKIKSTSRTASKKSSLRSGSAVTPNRKSK